LNFTDLRFGLLTASDATPNEADRSRQRNGSATVDDRMDAWLKEARTTMNIEFKKEAFQ
jgi:hypothetical protein